MKQQFPRLMAPIKVRNTYLRNRLMATTSVPHFISGPEKHPNDHMILHHAKRAAAGAGVITVSHTYDSDGPFSFPGMGGDPPHFPEFDVWEPKNQNYMIMMNDAIHYYGSKSCWDLALSVDFEYDVVENEFGAKPLTLERVDRYIDLLGEQIDLVKPLGFDMISIHCAYQDTFMARFLSPAVNKRTDEYGGCFENRIKMPLHVLREVRKRTPKDILISIAISSSEPGDGYDVNEFIRFCDILDEEGLVDILQIRAGFIDDSHPTGYQKKNPILHDSEILMKHGFKNLVIAPVGGFQDPFDMEQALEEGKADMFCAARMWIADPEWGDKIAEGRPEDITPCILCNRCHVIANNVPYMSMCSVNPTFGIQHQLQNAVKPVKRLKQVAVVGGGAAGLRAACYLADRGHTVTLYEASDHLGGSLVPASVPEFKWPLKRYLDWLLKQVAKRPIRIMLNTPASPELIRDMGYDACIAAVGAVPAVPPIPGVEGNNVITALDALNDPSSVKGRAVVIGGGEVGTETAIHLGRSGVRTTILEMLPVLAQECNVPHIGTVIQHAVDTTEALDFVTGATVTGITAEGVSYKTAEGESFIPCDTVVLAAGFRSLQDAGMNYYGIVPETWVIGDCTKPGNLMFANRQAFAAANNI